MPLELPQLAATALGEGVLPPRHCSGRGNLVATTWRTVLEGVLACRLFGTGLRDAGAATVRLLSTSRPGEVLLVLGSWPTAECRLA